MTPGNTVVAQLEPVDEPLDAGLQDLADHERLSAESSANHGMSVSIRDIAAELRAPVDRRRAWRHASREPRRRGSRVRAHATGQP